MDARSEGTGVSRRKRPASSSRVDGLDRGPGAGVVRREGGGPDGSGGFPAGVPTQSFGSRVRHEAGTWLTPLATRLERLVPAEEGELPVAGTVPLASGEASDLAARRRRRFGLSYRRTFLAVLTAGLATVAWVAMGVEARPLAGWLSLLPAIWALGLLGFPVVSSGTSLYPTVAPRSVGVVLATPPGSLRRGDLVAVATASGRSIVRRVIALQGDTVVASAHGVTVNDAPPAGSVLPANTLQIEPSLGLQWRLGPQEVFLLGDHIGSRDSRHVGPVRRADIIGRYYPVFGWGRVEPTGLTPADEADIAWVRGGTAQARAPLERMLAVAGWRRGHLAIVLRWAMIELGDWNREEALLERMLGGEDEPQDRALWAMLLAERRMIFGRPASALDALDASGTDHGECAARIAELRAAALARMGWWQPALVAGLEWEHRWPGRGLSLARLAALIGLGRLDEAERLIAHTTRADHWGLPCWEPYYRACLHTARGDLAPAARSVDEAIKAGFLDQNLLRSARLLDPLRQSEHWAEIERSFTAPAVHAAT